MTGACDVCKQTWVHADDCTNKDQALGGFDD